MKNKDIILQVKSVDYDNCGKFIEPENCLLATAAKRQFNGLKVSCGLDNITITKRLFFGLIPWNVTYYFNEFGLNEYKNCSLNKTEFELTLSKKNRYPDSMGM